MPGAVNSPVHQQPPSLLETRFSKNTILLLTLLPANLPVQLFP